MDSSEIMREYKNTRQLYENFTDKMENLITELLQVEHFNTHSISSRTKEISSLESKIKKGGKYYNKLTEITDLSGVRIICFFSDDVDRVAEIVRKNFKVNDEKTVDKRKILEPDRFGYLSLHYIVEFPENRIKLREFKRFEGLICEIQIRSILQHAWAEIEHDFGYKSSISIPKEIRRKFSRQAGLLELADEQFVTIKNEIEAYTDRIRVEISQSYDNISIDGVSIKDYLKNSATVMRIDSKIGVKRRAKLNMVENIVGICEYFNILTIDELERKILENEEKIIKFTKIYDPKPSSRGHSIWYFGYMLAGLETLILMKSLNILNFKQFLRVLKTSKIVWQEKY